MLNCRQKKLNVIIQQADYDLSIEYRQKKQGEKYLFVILKIHQ